MFLKRKGRLFRSSRVSAVWHRIKAVTGRIVFRRFISRNRDARILVVLHLYYMDAWPFIKRYLDNLSPYRYDLAVSYVTGHYDRDVLESVREFKQDVRLFEFENKGFDIGSFLDILSKSCLQDYDIVFKIQSKGVGRGFIYIYGQVFKKADWFFNLFDGILGEFNVHRAVNLLMRKAGTGLVASSNLIVPDPPHKRYFTLKKSDELCIPIPEEYCFVAGSCFAVKASLLTVVQNLNLTIDSFEPTRRGVFSLAHAMERIVCACVEQQGQRLAGISVPHPRYCYERRFRRTISALRLLEDGRFTVDYEYFYRSLEMYPVYSYEVKPMRLGDIRRYWEGQLYPLSECSPYAYLCGDVKRYENYTAVNLEETGFDMSHERFDSLIKSLEEKGFDQRQLPIICAQDNTVWDGLHRCCWLLAKYGEDYEIPVLYLNTRSWYHTSDNDNPVPRLNAWDKLFRVLSRKASASTARKRTDRCITE